MGNKSKPRKFNNRMDSLDSKIDYYISPYNKMPMVHRYIDFKSSELSSSILIPNQSSDDPSKSVQLIWHKISEMICNPKKAPIFNETINLIKKTHHTDTRKRNDMEERLMRVRLEYCYF
jgi:hypothetical protein